MDQARRIRIVRGAGMGGKSGGGQTSGAKEDKDTLISKSFARVIDVLCEGEIEGFVHPDTPLKDIILDGTPIENSDGYSGSDATFVNQSDEVTFVTTPWYKVHIGRVIYSDSLEPNTIIEDVIGDQPSHKIKLSKPAIADAVPDPIPSPPPHPLKNWTLGGSLNHKNFAYYFLKGMQGQSYLPGFSAEENFNGVNIQIKKSLGSSGHAEVIAPNTDAVSIDIRIPRLQEQDPKTGDIHGSKARIQIFLNNLLVKDDEITGKSSSGYIRTYRVELAGHPPPWTIKIVRITQDAKKQNISNETWWESFTEIVYGKLTHPNTALIGIHFDASQFSNIPVRGYHMKGLRIRVPANYDPDLRIYATSGTGVDPATGLWNGTFKIAWTDNPAWCWYAMATNTRWGLGNVTKESDINKWLVYVIGKYCDQPVPTGLGAGTGPWKNGNEPRFSCNLYIQKANDAYKVLSDMLGICRASLAYSGGQLYPTQDSPVDPASYRMFSPVNVINGVFTYSGTARKARHNSVKVSYADLNDNGETKWEYVEDSDAIAKTGVINMLEIAGFGCSSRGQARRWALGALTMERILNDTVTFSTALEGNYILPGQVISVQDPFRAGKQLSGRLTNASNTLLTLDRPITLTAGFQYFVQIINPETGKIMTATVANGAGTTQTITPTVPLVEIPDTQSVFQLGQVNGLVPELFRVIGVASRDLNLMDVTALQHNPDLYDFIDFNEPLDIPVTQQLPNVGPVQPPGKVWNPITKVYDDAPPPIILAEEIMIIDRVNGLTWNLEVTWKQSPDPFLDRYRFWYQFNNGNWVTLPDVVSPMITIPNVVPGVYRFAVIAINTIGIHSTTVPGSYAVPPYNPLPAPNVTGLELWGQGNNHTFQQRDAKFVWRMNSPAAFVDFTEGEIQGGHEDPMFQAFECRVFTVANPRELIYTELTNKSELTFTLEKNREAMRARHGEGTTALNQFIFMVRILDTFQHFTDDAHSAWIYVGNPAPSAPTGASVHGTLTGVALQWQNGPENDLDHVTTFMSLDRNDTSPDPVSIAAYPSTSDIYNGLQPTPIFVHFWVAAVDSFGNQSALTYAGQTVPGYAVESCTFNPDGGYILAGGVAVTIATVTRSTIVYYKLGAGPWTLYTAPVTVAGTSGTSVQMWAVAAMASNPQIYSLTIVKTFNFTTNICSTPTITPNGGSFAVAGGIYGPVTLTTATVGANIKYTWDGTDPGISGTAVTIPASSGTISIGTGTWTIKAVATKATFSNSAMATSTPFIITNTSLPVVATPTFTPQAGAYTGSGYPKPVTVTTATPLCYIHYTTDGTAPTPTHGTLIAASSGTASVPANSTLKAIAHRTGYNNSAIASGLYSVLPVCAAPTFVPVAGTYASTFFVPSNVRLNCATAGSTIFYHFGVAPILSVSPGTLITVAAGATLYAQATKAGLDASVIVAGTFLSQTPATTPSFTPGAGAYISTDFPKPVSITSAAGSTIYWTNDGTTPTTAHYNGTGPTPEAATVSAGQTLRAIATHAGNTQSALATALYTALTSAAMPSFTPTGAYPITGTHTANVRIDCASPGVTIRWLKDATPSRTVGTIIAPGDTVSFQVTAAGTVLRAIAYSGTLSDSPIKADTYYFESGG